MEVALSLVAAAEFWIGRKPGKVRLESHEDAPDHLVGPKATPDVAVGKEV